MVMPLGLLCSRACQQPSRWQRGSLQLKVSIDEGALSAVSSSLVVHCVNDQVWAVGSSAFAEFAVAKCSQMSLKPNEKVAKRSLRLVRAMVL